MSAEFPEAVLTVGVLLAVSAALSGLARGTVVSLSVLAVAAGMALDATDRARRTKQLKNARA